MGLQTYIIKADLISKTHPKERWIIITERGKMVWGARYGYKSIEGLLGSFQLWINDPKQKQFKNTLILPPVELDDAEAIELINRVHDEKNVKPDTACSDSDTEISTDDNPFMMSDNNGQMTFGEKHQYINTVEKIDPLERIRQTDKPAGETDSKPVETPVIHVSSRWNEKETQELIDAYNQNGFSTVKFAKQHDRTYKAVNAKLNRLAVEGFIEQTQAQKQANRIITLCKEKNIPVSHLEKACGLSNNYIGKLKKAIPTIWLEKIAEHLGVSVEEITGSKNMLMVKEFKKPSVKPGSKANAEMAVSETVTPATAELITTDLLTTEPVMPAASGEFVRIEYAPDIYIDSAKSTIDIYNRYCSEYYAAADEIQELKKKQELLAGKLEKLRNAIGCLKI